MGLINFYGLGKWALRGVVNHVKGFHTEGIIQVPSRSAPTVVGT